MAETDVEHTAVYIENLFKYLRSREEVFGRFFAILATVLGSIGYTLINAPHYTWLAIVMSNLVLLAGAKYLSTLSYNYRYLQMCLSKIECLTGTTHYIPNTWNLIVRKDDLCEKEFMPDIFKGFLSWMQFGSAIITLGGLVEALCLVGVSSSPGGHELLEKWLPHLSECGTWLFLLTAVSITSLLMLSSATLVFLLPRRFTKKVFDHFKDKFAREKIMQEVRDSADDLGIVLGDNLKRRFGK